MNDLCKQAISVWIETVNREVTKISDVETYARNYDGKFSVWISTELYGAYWALRGMTRDCVGFVDMYTRMEEYFDSHCTAIMAAFEEN